MKITTPNDKLSDVEALVENAVSMFEEKLKAASDNSDKYIIPINIHCSRLVMDKVEELYTYAGWKAGCIIRYNQTNACYQTILTLERP